MLSFSTHRCPNHRYLPSVVTSFDCSWDSSAGMSLICSSKVTSGSFCFDASGSPTSGDSMGLTPDSSGDVSPSVTSRSKKIFDTQEKNYYNLLLVIPVSVLFSSVGDGDFDTPPFPFFFFLPCFPLPFFFFFLDLSSTTSSGSGGGGFGTKIIIQQLY